MADAPAEGGEGQSIESLGGTPELIAHAKTMWMVNIFNFGLLYLMFVEKPGQWQNPWFVSQVRALVRASLFNMVCWPIGAFFAFKGFSAVGGGKDPVIPFACPNGAFADAQSKA
jgi:hypothetical protein